jgi:hypothetical protein
MGSPLFPEGITSAMGILWVGSGHGRGIHRVNGDGSLDALNGSVGQPMYDLCCCMRNLFSLRTEPSWNGQVCVCVCVCTEPACHRTSVCVCVCGCVCQRPVCVCVCATCACVCIMFVCVCTLSNKTLTTVVGFDTMITRYRHKDRGFKIWADSGPSWTSVLSVYCIF